ncbi:hypothetical protein [Streptococcus ruminantium]|uniref:hypothetical protein n=1 Tax=Streptococcus ruminantium TaxID=1917441 RepID=UPI0012DF34FD|nr:hypothetical protein [Streptococcus ruminantium]BDD38990.1 hypothetical protein GUT183_12280 [Streptococcus ruminantium]BDD40600.1 hypothetical protein GUT184_08640 [Streptococcus ruminantium]
MKNIILNKRIIIIGILSILLMFFLQIKSNTYHLKPDEEQFITIKGNTQSLDALIEIQVISYRNVGRIKLSYGHNWYNSNAEIHYNIATAQVEKWEYDSALGKSVATILQNPLDGIEVDKEGINIDTPKDVTFSFHSKEDFTIRIKNLSDKDVSVEVNVVYR